MAKRPFLVRDFQADLEVRGGDGRTVVGLCAPFSTPAEISDISGRYTEDIAPTAFDRTLAERGPERVKFLCQHDRTGLPLGRAVVLEPRPEGLWGEFRVSATPAGDHALELIRDRALDSLSIGFQPIRDKWNATRTAVTRLEVRLAEVSACWAPAYETAAIAGVRSAVADDPQYDRERWLHRLRIKGLAI